MGRWKGGQQKLKPGTDPSKYFESVTPGSLGGGASPGPIYVLAHGWAPGYRDVVKLHGGLLRWWDSGAHANGIWTSDWAWTPVTADTIFFGKIPVNETGVLQQVVTQEPNAVALAYSWLDDSATGGSYSDLLDVYQSEAYTQLNGIRLANALEQAIAASFWTSSGGGLRLMGHSHGSKVVTVAAHVLQQRGRPVAHLTILDAPETETALALNGANLLGFYLEDLQIADPSYPGSGGAFVDNYPSYFGVAYTGTPTLKKVVDVALDPYELYDLDDPSDLHAYAAAWYGGAAAGAQENGDPPVGLVWPPPQMPYTPALNQNWSNGVNEQQQWILTAGQSIRDAYAYQTKPLDVKQQWTLGNVQGSPSTRLVFGGSAETPPVYSVFQGTYKNDSNDKFDYGIAFDLTWIMPRPGDYFVVVMESYWGTREVLLVMDGASSPGGKISVAINCDVEEGATYSLTMYFLAPLDTTALPLDLVFVSNFRTVVVSSQSGLLEASPQARYAQRLTNQVVTAPKHCGKPL